MGCSLQKTPHQTASGWGEVKAFPPRPATRQGCPLPPRRLDAAPAFQPEPGGRNGRREAFRLDTRKKSLSAGRRRELSWGDPPNPARPHPQVWQSGVRGQHTETGGLADPLHCFGQQREICTGSCQRSSVYTGIQGARNAGHSLSHGARRPARRRLGKAAGRGEGGHVTAHTPLPCLAETAAEPAPRGQRFGANPRRPPETEERRLQCWWHLPGPQQPRQPVVPPHNGIALGLNGEANPDTGPHGDGPGGRCAQ